MDIGAEIGLFPHDLPVGMSQTSSLYDGLVLAARTPDGWNWRDTSVRSRRNTFARVTAGGSLTPSAIQDGRFQARAMQFDGANNADRVDLGSVASGHPLHMGGGVQITVAAWFYLAGTGNGFPRVIDKSDGASGANGWALSIGNTVGTDRFPVLYIGGSTAVSTTSIALATGQVHFLAIAYDSVNSNRTLLLVNNRRYSISRTDALTIPTGTTNAAIGNWNHTTGRQFDGKLFGVWVWNRALWTHELRQLYIPQRWTRQFSEAPDLTRVGLPADNTPIPRQQRVPYRPYLPVDMSPHLRQALDRAFELHATQINWATAHTVQTMYSSGVAGTDLVLADASVGTVTVALVPAIKWRDRIIRVKKIDPSVRTVIVQPASGETIDGTACATISAQYSTMRLFSDGTQWWKV